MRDQKAGAAVMDQQKPSDAQALAKREDRTEIITTPTEFDAALKRWGDRYHVLSPFTQISGLAVQHGIIVSQVRINSDPAKNGPGDVYDGLPFLARNDREPAKAEVAIAKIGLRKIAEAAGISTTTIRTDGRFHPFYWEVKAVATYRGIDGATVTREATVEWDLRDGSPRLKGWTKPQIEEGRKNGLRACETRAINAAIREFGIKQKYTRAELEKPFVCLRVAFQPDMNDPEQKRIVTERALGSTAALYPSRALPSAGGPELLDTFGGEEPRHVGSGSAATAPAAESSPKEDQPPTERAVRIVDVKEKSGETNGRKWTKFTIVDSADQAYSTFDTKLREVAEDAKKSRAWVELHYETDGQYRNLIEIEPAGQSPTLPGLGNL